MAHSSIQVPVSPGKHCCPEDPEPYGITARSPGIPFISFLSKKQPDEQMICSSGFVMCLFAGQRIIIFSGYYEATPLQVSETHASSRIRQSRSYRSIPSSAELQVRFHTRLLRPRKHLPAVQTPGLHRARFHTSLCLLCHASCPCWILHIR